MSTINAPIVVQNTYITSQELVGSLVDLLSKPLAIDEVCDRVAFKADLTPEVVELLAFDDYDALGEYLQAEQLERDANALRKLMTHDVRREILTMHTPVKPSATYLPTSEKFQQRYIEVPGMVLPEYFQWRIKTIFAHVLKREDVHSFLAYHSLVSSTPGVYFFVEFDSSYESLMSGFTSPEYQEIIRQADQFIVGGNVNLSTKGFERIYVSAALLEPLAETMQAEA